GKWWSARLTNCSCSIESPDPSNGYFASVADRAPQMVLRVESPQVDAMPSDVSPLTRLSAANFSHMALLAEYEPFGGYSGGPIMYFCESGNYLMGIMTQGNHNLVFGSEATLTGTVSPEMSVAYGVPMDEIVYVIRSSI